MDMKAFLSEDFLLSTPTARTLYHQYAKDMPICDYHCHVSPREIYEDRQFDNIAQVWLGGDHYKWRLMRSNAIDEYYITGAAPDREKFQKFAETLPKAIGNPMYHWCHLELKNYFGYEGILNGHTAEEVWKLANEKLQNGLTVRKLIDMSRVRFIGTTDDPIDSLEWHKKLMEDAACSFTVAPSFRPDKAFNADKPGYLAYIQALCASAQTEINSYDQLEEALSKRIRHFNDHGCKASDHGFDYLTFEPCTREDAQKAFELAMTGKILSAQEAAPLKTMLLLHCAKEYVRYGWVMQIHYNCLRNPNTLLLEKLGPDTGFDCIRVAESTEPLRFMLDEMYKASVLPKTVLYSLNGGDNNLLDSLIGAFQGTEVPGKLQHGSAWWFNDHKTGMQEQLTSLANLSLLGNFIGMLTDSRSFLSYARHEYFRRILCELIGSWIENGEYPEDYETVGAMVQDICFRNAERYFNL